MKTVIVVNGIVSARDAFGVFEAEHFAFQKSRSGAGAGHVEKNARDLKSRLPCPRK